ncbi:hypothetical protein H0H81_011910 [Sphagnurus paluster]|uniref:Methyltransferase-domain-containing protein n=1 Tax=Sphagnurus paluster TaxID=117069 RepID=A0A9P7K6X6_9AGAR|nr:hypothetical protein H0H81_011910 [Sphagnurus paluster]
MFFYVSFLRPPPLESVTFGSILITPQIANDLRTEPLDTSVDIFYSWVQATNISASHTVLAQREIATKPAKLTTWRAATAYKEIPVPLPPGVRDGLAWRLVLATRPAASLEEFTAVDLFREDTGNQAVPVVSMPIMFNSRAVRKGAKQEHVERVYRLRPKVGDEEEVKLTIKEQTSFDLDKKVWDSGVGLSSWLVGLAKTTDPEGKIFEIKDALFSAEPRNILELGTGIGIVGITLAALRSTLESPFVEQARTIQDRIILTDLESAIPLIDQNISANAKHLRNVQLNAQVLDWDEELPAYVRELEDGLNSIIMADVTYNTASFPALVSTLGRLIRLSKKPPLVLLGYKERDAAERTLWELAGEIGIHFEKIGERGGAGGAPVEIWLGSVDTSQL